MNIKKTKLAACLAGLALAGLASTATAADIQERKLKFSYPVTKDNPVGMAAEKYRELVAEKSGGKIQITTYSDAQLGNEIQSMSSAQGGIIEMAVVSSAGAAGTVKDLAVFDLPFVFNTVQEADAVVDGPVGKKLLAQFEDKNLVGLCYWDYGFRQVTNSKHPINKLEDFEGLKIRTLQNRVYIDIFRALGANPLPLPYPETYTALETKAIDGQESAYLVTKSSSYQDIQTYLTATRHVYLPAPVLVSKRFWDRLSADEKTIFQEACDESTAYHRQVSRKMETEVVKELIAAGMKFNEIEPAERARIEKAVQPVFEQYRKEIGEDLVDEMLAEIQKVRQQNS